MVITGYEDGFNYKNLRLDVTHLTDTLDCVTVVGDATTVGYKDNTYLCAFTVYKVHTQEISEKLTQTFEKLLAVNSDIPLVSAVTYTIAHSVSDSVALIVF